MNEDNKVLPKAVNLQGQRIVVIQLGEDEINRAFQHKDGSVCFLALSEEQWHDVEHNMNVVERELGGEVWQ